MKRLSALLLASALGAWLTGCATSPTSAQAPALAHTQGGLVAVASGHEHDVRASAPAAMDNARTFDNTHEGIPLPEPALPARDLFAGPTPQIPIPRSGSMASPVN